LVETAAQVFNREGYFGTDTNRLARAAGYAPGTFYKHFADKRAIFLHAYEHWVESEWRAIDAIVARTPEATQVVDRLVRAILAHHQRWAGFRASLVSLAATDPEVAAFRVERRRRQLTWFAATLARLGARPASPARLLAVMLTFERLCDAVASGETAALGVKRGDVLAELRATLAAVTRPASP
jgi:AcrR family transcriptional regulator